MATNSINTKRGFTIIEVVLVLAIAGLIFLMVFIALPNMQMSQRNTRRRNDYSSLSTMITTYSSNNNGKMPTDATNIKATWLNSDGTDADGNGYNVGLVACTTGTTNCGIQVLTTDDSGDGEKYLSRTSALNPGATYDNTKAKQVFVVTNAECNGNSVQYKQGNRNFAIYGYVETAASSKSSDDHYCLASHA